MERKRMEVVSSRRIGRYVLGERLGRGGMGEVFVARRIDTPPEFEQLFAVKLVHPHLLDDPAHRKQVLKEARIASTMAHPNIVRMLDMGVEDDSSFLVFEYMHGVDAGTVMRKLPRGQALPLVLALRIVRDVARALEYAHRLRDTAGEPIAIVHRDVSPSNIMVGFDGSVKLTDFGVARITSQTSSTEAGALKGKLGYMAPESLEGVSLDGRADVFALGVVLFELTTGRRCFTGPNVFAVMNRASKSDYPRPTEIVQGYPGALEAIVERALAAKPRERFQSARALGDALSDLAAELDLTLDDDGLAHFMRELFGPSPLPKVDMLEMAEWTDPAAADETLGEAFAAVSTVKTTPRSRSLRAVLVPVTALVVGAGIMLAFRATPEAATLRAGVASVRPPTPAPAIVAANADEPDPPAAEEPEPPAVAPEPTRRRRPKGARKSKNDTIDADIMLPPSMRKASEAKP